MEAHRSREHGSGPGRAPRSVAELRGRAGAALLRAGGDLAAERRAVVRRISETPAGTPGRALALGHLAIGGWMESVLLWLGWRLLPGDAVTDRAASPRP